MPLLVKIAPDLADDDIAAVADLALELGLDGIIATNTTIRAGGLVTPGRKVERSAPAGSPARRSSARSLEVLRLLNGRASAAIPLVVASAASRRPTTPARGSTPAPTLVQGYTAFVYEGPLWPARIIRGLASSGKPS